jgi:hypothetical protein
VRVCCKEVEDSKSYLGEAAGGILRGEEGRVPPPGR